MRGYLTLTRKEGWELFKTYRVLIAAAVFLLAGISGPLLTYYLPDLIKNSAQTSIQIIVHKQTSADAITSYLSNVTGIPMLAVILLAMGAVSEERSRGIAVMILYRPISRTAYLLAKATAQGVMLLGTLALGAAAAFYYTVLLFSGAQAGPFIQLNLGVAMMLMDVLSLTLLASVIFRSSIAAGGAAFVLYILYSIIPGFWAPLGNSLPAAITKHAPEILAGSWTGSDSVQPLIGGLVLTAVVLAAACVILRGQEV